MILSVGCSWTYGTGVAANETYSAHLQDIYKVPVINAGAPGTDIEYSIWSTYRLLKEYSPKLVLFQLTTLDRMTFSSDGFQNFLNGKYHDGSSQPIYKEDGNYIRLHGIGDNTIEYITVAGYMDSLNNKNEKSVAIKYFNERVVYGNLKQEKISMQLQLLKAYLNLRNIDVVFFPWLHWHKEFSKTIDAVDIRQDSVVEFLGDEYYVDKGFHINNEGHRRVAEEYISPMIKGFLNG